MAPEEIFVVGRVRIVLGVGMTMMQTMMSRPPKRSALSRGTGDKGTQKLNNSSGVEGSVRKVAVVEGSNRKHSGRI